MKDSLNFLIMSYVRILVHTVWTTKNRLPYLNDKIRDDVIHHIREYIRNQVIHHRKTSFEDELDILIREYGLERKWD